MLRVACVDEFSRARASRQSEAAMFGRKRNAKCADLPATTSLTCMRQTPRSTPSAPTRSSQFVGAWHRDIAPPPGKVPCRVTAAATDAGFNAVVDPRSAEINQQLVVRITTNANVRRTDSEILAR
jgi:hypothetical protein